MAVGDWENIMFLTTQPCQKLTGAASPIARPPVVRVARRAVIIANLALCALRMAEPPTAKRFVLSSERVQAGPYGGSGRGCTVAWDQDGEEKPKEETGQGSHVFPSAALVACLGSIERRKGRD